MFPRRLRLEPLEPRQLLSGDGLAPSFSEPAAPRHHAELPTDVNRDGRSDAADLVAVFQVLLTSTEATSASYDVDNDGVATPNDLRLVLVRVLTDFASHPWHNAAYPEDVDGDSVVTDRDVAAIQLRLEASGEASEPIDFDAADGEPVDLVFGMMVPTEINDGHHADIKLVTRVLADEGLRARLRGMNSSSGLYDALLDGASLAAPETLRTAQQS